MTGPAYLNGKFYEGPDAVWPYNDLGLHRGFAIFDFLRTRQGRPFLLPRYLDRFERSAQQLGISVPHTREEITQIIDQLLAKKHLPEVGIRLLLTAGVAEGAEAKPHFGISLSGLEPPTAAQYQHGAALITQAYQRQFPAVKTTDYLMAWSLKSAIKEAQAMEVLYHHAGFVAECARCNVFVVKDGTLATPKEGILMGITRGKVLELAEELGLAVEQCPVTLTELMAADEVFVTSTQKGVCPIAKIDGRAIGHGKPGEVTQKLMEAFFAVAPALNPIS